MMTLVGVLILLVLAFMAIRHWLLHREIAMLAGEVFDGVVYPVGNAAVAERCYRGTNSSPTATVICMHGFVENMGYFTHFYERPDIQLILLTSCGYHLPIDQPECQYASWAQTPAAVEGTIEYDAMVLNQALEHLPRSPYIRVHGHSRGGAVVLEAASLRPDLFTRVEVILEAPVLPQAGSYREFSQRQLWLLSFLVPLWRRQPIGPHNRKAWGPLESERKRLLIEGLPFNPKRVSTMVTNIRSMGHWMQSRPLSLYCNIHQGCVLVAADDRVLDARSMYESASQGARPGLSVVWLEDCSHFPLFDRPEALPPLPLPLLPLAVSQADVSVS